MRLSALIALFGAVGWAQSNGPASAQGTCNGSNTGNGGTVTVTCNNVDKKLAEQIKELVTAATRDGKTLQEISERLNKLLKEFQDPPTSSEIAAAIANKTRTRELFARELDKPIFGMYLIVSLSKPLAQDKLSGIAGLGEIFDVLDEGRPSLCFGFRPDAQEMTQMPGNKKIVLNGIRSEVWSFPRVAMPDAKVSMIDSLLVFRFDFLNRLEVGAVMETPFKSVGQLDHAAVHFSATRPLLDYLDRITLVVNDYVVFQATKADISWSPPYPPMTFGVFNIQTDPSTGRIINQETVKTVPLDPNHGLGEGFREFQFFHAHFSPGRTAIDLTETEISVHRVVDGLFMVHRAGNGSMTILPGQHGWLPEKP
jgi:hypothetical protein